MKRIIAVLFIVLFASLTATMPVDAGVVRHGVKPVAKVATYPARHPKRSVQHVAHAVHRVIW